MVEGKGCLITLTCVNQMFLYYFPPSFQSICPEPYLIVSLYFPFLPPYNYLITPAPLISSFLCHLGKYNLLLIEVALFCLTVSVCVCAPFNFTLNLHQKYQDFLNLGVTVKSCLPFCLPFKVLKIFCSFVFVRFCVHTLCLFLVLHIFKKCLLSNLISLILLRTCWEFDQVPF